MIASYPRRWWALGALAVSLLTIGLDLTGLPAQVAETARGSAMSAVAVAGKLGSPALADSARAAFLHGMSGTLWTCGGIAVAGLLLALAFLPGREAPEVAEAPQSEHDVVAS